MELLEWLPIFSVTKKTRRHIDLNKRYVILVLMEKKHELPSTMPFGQDDR